MIIYVTNTKVCKRTREASNIYEYQHLGQLIICGDFNSRIGDMPDQNDIEQVWILYQAEMLLTIILALLIVTSP